MMPHIEHAVNTEVGNTDGKFLFESIKRTIKSSTVLLIAYLA